MELRSAVLKLQRPAPNSAVVYGTLPPAVWERRLLTMPLAGIWLSVWSRLRCWRATRSTSHSPSDTMTTPNMAAWNFPFATSNCQNAANNELEHMVMEVSVDQTF